VRTRSRKRAHQNNTKYFLCQQIIFWIKNICHTHIYFVLLYSMLLSDMDHFMFECLSKHDRPTNKDESEMGWQYISLLEHTAESMQSNTKTRTHRCAVSILCLPRCDFKWYINVVGELVQPILLFIQYPWVRGRHR